MHTKSDHGGGGVDFIGLLTIVFITLKLIGEIDWSWWWVLSPVLIVLGILACVVSALGVVYIAVLLIPEKTTNQQKENK